MALRDAIDQLLQIGELARSPIIHQVAAISVGLLENQAFLDLAYEEDVAADVDCNIVLNEELQIIELQGTAEEGSFSRQQLNQILDLGEKGIQELMTFQNAALGS